MTKANEPDVTVAETVGVVDPSITADDFVAVVHKTSGKDAKPGLMSREYFDGWGKDLGWVEAK